MYVHIYIYDIYMVKWFIIIINSNIKMQVQNGVQLF